MEDKEMIVSHIETDPDTNTPSFLIKKVNGSWQITTYLNGMPCITSQQGPELKRITFNLFNPETNDDRTIAFQIMSDLEISTIITEKGIKWLLDAFSNYKK